MDSLNFPCPVGFRLTSSQLSSVGYLPDQQMLVVCFPPNNKRPQGSVYSYDNVLASEFDDLMNATSHGSHFINAFKKQPGLHPFQKHAITPDGAFNRILDRSQYNGVTSLRAISASIPMTEPFGIFLPLCGFENAPWAW